MQVDYKNKCGTCIYINPTIKGKYGECTKFPSRGLGWLSLSRVRCRNYKFNEKAYCQCETFIQAGWNYCANCGQRLEGIAHAN